MLPIYENKNPSRWGTWKRRLSDISHSSDSWMFLIAPGHGCGAHMSHTLQVAKKLWDFSTGENLNPRLPEYKCRVGQLAFPETSEQNWGQAHLLSYPVPLAVEPQHQDWLAVILGPAISVPFATCYAALICSDASLRSHFPMVLQHLDWDFCSDWPTSAVLYDLKKTWGALVCQIEPFSSASAWYSKEV